MPAGFDLSATTFMPPTCGKRPAPSSIFEKAVFEGVPHLLAGHFHHHRHIAKGQFCENVAAGNVSACRVFLVGANAAAAEDGDFGTDGFNHRVGDEVADGSFLGAHDVAARVERSLSLADDDVEFLVEFGLVAIDHLLGFRVRRHVSRVDEAELRFPFHRALAVLFLHVHHQVDGYQHVGFG